MKAIGTMAGIMTEILLGFFFVLIKVIHYRMIDSAPESWVFLQPSLIELSCWAVDHSFGQKVLSEVLRFFFLFKSFDMDWEDEEFNASRSEDEVILDRIKFNCLHDALQLGESFRATVIA